ncbi:NBR1-Ig-like domain-containing protein [Allokutzneria sp. A3M-2-11 16]|uniref:NBR1-Ig-like domain-containing protein n=1 Tax=Allokutzneria sp. A3M-2-11 16 TaxID=2962043 RepID=UPI0020B783B6|nr:NBR1-Ig-like domain-containing protein [Allokutzneria sp. A3M-2-11 16]MCP3802307.1 NBR1-Ig-like domain-containing protein [Allokutzneria sp. A3M-2-11 16]
MRTTVPNAKGRRGRTAHRPDSAAGPVGRFAVELWELKRAAGDPSYDRMRSELGALASKSALSAAARGERLPTWETTWEFVRVLAVGVLGENEDAVRAAWRERWELAATPIRAVPHPVRWRTWRLAAVLVVVLVATGVVGTGPTPSKHAFLVTGGAVVGSVVDVSEDQASEIRVGDLITKVWEFHNTSPTWWDMHELAKVEQSGSCRTPTSLAVPPISPGAKARVAVLIKAPPEPESCRSYWNVVEGKEVLHRAVARIDLKITR